MSVFAHEQKSGQLANVRSELVAACAERGLRGTGATSTLRLGAQAKALDEWLRAYSTKVAQSLVNT